MILSVNPTQQQKEGRDKAVAAAGSESELARRLEIRVQSVQQWKRIDDKWLLQVEEVTGVPREELRPDLFRRANGNRQRGQREKSRRAA